MNSQIDQTHSGSGHNVAGNLNIYNINNIDLSTELAIASLIGCWNEKNDADIIIIEKMIDETYSSWIKKIRVIEGLDDSPLVHEQGIWKFKNRLNTFLSVSSRLFDSHIQTFKDTIINVLSVVDTQYDLNPEDRFAAPIYGKGFPHSNIIRKGLSEGLAIISTNQHGLSNCSKNIGQFTANIVVESIFLSTDWKLWASTQDVQMMLSEASPDYFIDAVEKSVSSREKPFDVLFSQEGVGGVTGRNYLTSLLWALEGLSWSPDFLSRSLVLLGELDSHDPGGNWANRPSNSIVDILLPWYPHTAANITLKFAAFNALNREFPETAWKVLLQLLPTKRQTTMGTHVSVYRQFIPDDFEKKITEEEYTQQIVYYSELAIKLAKQKSERIIDLVDNLDNLAVITFDKAITLLDEIAVSSIGNDERVIIWEHCLQFYNRHKKFAHAHWAMPSEKIDQLLPLIESLKPKDHRLFSRRLFGQRTYDLFEDDNWNEREQKLSLMRKDAVIAIYDEYNISGILEFVETIEQPNIVGDTLAISDITISNELIKKLISDDKISLKRFISGYVWCKYNKNGISWVNSTVIDWEHDEVIKLLLLLPFIRDIWEFIEISLSNDDITYWENISLNNYYCKSTDDLYYAVDKLLANNRPLAAIDCLSRVLYTDKIVDEARVIKALLMAINTIESSRSLDVHYLRELIKFLQVSDNITLDELIKIEWAYLPFIRNHSSDKLYPQHLEKKLAIEPDFFCEILQLAFRSKYQKNQAELNESQRNIATNAYDLLDNWGGFPFLDIDGKFDKVYFYDWFNKVKTSCEATGHLNISYQIIGKALIHSPSEPNVCWIHSDIAEFLNQKDLDDVRIGFENAIISSRGVHFIDPEGKPELALFEEYQDKAYQVELLGFPRFAKMLRGISERYKWEAESIIEQHQQQD